MSVPIYIVPLFWTTLGGTMGLVLPISTIKGRPPVDLTTVVAARFRLVASTAVVTHLDATVLEGAIATRCEIRHPLTEASGLALGVYQCWGEVSIDGSRWYPTEEIKLKVI